MIGQGSILVVLLTVLMSACGSYETVPAAPVAPEMNVVQPILVLDGPYETNDPGISSLPLGMYMQAVGFCDGILTLEISNQSGYLMEYGEDYALFIRKNGEWKELPWSEGYGWNDIAYTINDLETQLITADLSVFGKLESGEYRIVKSGMQAEFRLVWTE